MIDPTTRDAILNGPPEVQQAFLDSGFGLNWHNSRVSGGNHPGYNAFQIEALAVLSDLAAMNEWPLEASKRAVFDLHRFLSEVNLGPEPPVVGTSQAELRTAWEAWKTAQYGTVTPDYQFGSDFSALTAYIEPFDETPIDAGTDRRSIINADFRLEIVQKLYVKQA